MAGDGRHGIAIAPFDDTMLLSYVADAGTGGHGMDELSREMARPHADPLQGGGRLRQIA
jgi:DNA polymerase I-like protein with 3'-5' exonuclease and polymerase domains